MADDATLSEKRDRLLFIWIWLIELLVVNFLPGLGTLKTRTPLFVRTPTMSTQVLLVKAPVAPTPAKAQGALSGIAQPSLLWMVTSVGLALLLTGLAVFSKLQRGKLEKKLKFEQF